MSAERGILKRYTRVRFLRSGSGLDIKHKVEFIGGIELEEVEKPRGKHKRRKIQREKEQE